MSAQRIALGVAYHGEALSGWQRQRERATVQGHLEAALAQVAAAPVTTSAAGRTDAGVHATGQVCHFDAPVARPLRAWVLGVNTQLPPTIRVRWAQPVSADFHARFSATARRYCYLYADHAAWQPQFAGQAWAQPALDADAMHRAAQVLVGEQDFSAVRAAGCQSTTPMRFVQRVSVRRLGPLVALDIQANAFLLHMVRNIASALAQIGSRQRPEGWLRVLLDARDRTKLGPTAPASGLTLTDVRYAAEVPQPTGMVPALLVATTDLARL